MEETIHTSSSGFTGKYLHASSISHTYVVSLPVLVSVTEGLVLIGSAYLGLSRYNKILVQLPYHPIPM